VAVVARTEDELAETVQQVEAAGGRAQAFQADVADRQDVAETVRAVERTFGRIDLLVNNAGVGGPIGPAWQVDPERWWSCLEVNFLGTFCAAMQFCRVCWLAGTVGSSTSPAGLGRAAFPHVCITSARRRDAIHRSPRRGARECGFQSSPLHPGL
jgi:NAD(P)-dependent dehydrogenase (short-subunit alcohol dehydrogenase family)